MPPRRIQLRRTKGWRKPDGVIVVARPTRWGNPFTIGACIDAGYADTVGQARRVVVEAFRSWLNGDRWAAGSSPDWEERRLRMLDGLHDLAGQDLACWCPLDQPCHADVLLELANTEAVPS